MLTHTFGSQEACEHVLNNVPGNQSAEMSECWAGLMLAAAVSAVIFINMCYLDCYSLHSTVEYSTYGDH